ncbi:MAG: hypothetical protein JWQ09_4 [Segetibacter sp.]|nr:hypothetical protein [Segetibacter sp.]
MRKLYFFLLLLFISRFVNAQTVWTGPVITFTKAGSADPTLEANQDRITENVWITRGNTQGLFNIKKEASYSGNSPNDTEWATGTIDNYANLTYTNWFTWYGQSPTGIINENSVVHLISENIYIGIKFLSWGQRTQAGGSFSYQRTTASTLPITLKAFSASASKQNALLKWSTATELDNDRFEIEHSLNGRDFTPIAQVKANGTSTTEHSYTYLHENIAAGKHFYRIIDIDKNGNKRYSQIITLSSGGASTLQLYPNPATSFISVTASSLLQGNEFTISSLTGQMVLKGIISQQQIDVQKLTSGHYWFVVKTKDGELLKTQFLKR